MKDRRKYFSNWHQKNKLRRYARQAELRRLNPDAARKRDKAKRDRNQIAIRIAQKKYRSSPEYREYNRLRSKKYRSKNKEKLKAWRQKTGASVAYSQKRRAIKKNTAVNETGIRLWMARVRSSETARCYYCDAELPVSAIHFDHIIPLSKGGIHAIENLCTSCPDCNLSKWNKLVSLWQKVGQQILSL
jgi:5-methylcytosine-specific restriction endonuclease McrA